MATKIRSKTSDKKVVRFKRKARIRANLSGTHDRPRLCVFKSNKNFYAQLVDDVAEVTLASVSTADSELVAKNVKNNVEGVKQLGVYLAKRAGAKNITKVVFDRSGYIYHGRIRVFADAAREAGLQF